MSFRLHSRERVAGNREVSRECLCAERAVTWKKGLVGEHGSPTRARRSRATGVEVEK